MLSRPTRSHCSRRLLLHFRDKGVYLPYGEPAYRPAEILDESLGDFVLAAALANHPLDPISHGLEISSPFEKTGAIGKRTVTRDNRVEIELRDFIQSLGPFHRAAAIGVIDVGLRG